MDYKATTQKIIAEFCRLLLGAVFVFSGAVKAIDPMGGAIKIADYLTAFGLDVLRPFTLLISINLSSMEFTLGICLLLGAYRRYTSFLTLALMFFMTPLTLYLALFDPVSDCGCFGDALVISNWETFGKNVVLLAAAIYVYINNQRLLPFYTYKVYWFVALYAYAFSIGFAYWNYNHLPVIDFRPYKVGANIPALMSIPEGAPEDEYRYSFIYEKDNTRKEFSLEEIPDSTWTFVDSKTELIKQGYVPPISSFHIYGMGDEEVTDRLLANSKGMFLLICPRLEEADDERIDEINNVYDYTQDKGFGFYCVTGSTPEGIIAWSDNTGAEYPFLIADDVLLKTIIRSNPGLLLIRSGTILDKWHYNDIPSEEELDGEVRRLLDGNTGEESKEDAPLITNLFSFALPLLLVWAYDGWRNRRRRNTVSG